MDKIIRTHESLGGSNALQQKKESSKVFEQKKKNLWRTVRQGPLGRKNIDLESPSKKACHEEILGENLL